MSKHAVLSPSGAHRWMVCTGSVALSAGRPDSSSKYAEEGTAAHELAAVVLNDPSSNAADYLGKTVSKGWVVTADMARHVQEYVDYVRATPHYAMFLEVSMPLEHMTGEEDAEGTADAVLINGSELVVIDLKFGMGEEVAAENNPQLLMYASAALRHFAWAAPFDAVRCVIHQPRISAVPQEWVVQVSDVQAFENRVRNAAAAIGGETSLVPGTKQCRWCKAKATCPAIEAKIAEDLGDMFDVLPVSTDPLSTNMAAVELIEGWCASIREAVSVALRKGEAVTGWKLVMGNKPPRKWVDDAQAADFMQSMDVPRDMIYDRTVATPTSVEKYVKSGELNKDEWAQLSGLVTQGSAGMRVVKESDKKPAVKVDKTIDMFD